MPDLTDEQDARRIASLAHALFLRRLLRGDAKATDTITIDAPVWLESEGANDRPEVMRVVVKIALQSESRQ